MNGIERLARRLESLGCPDGDEPRVRIEGIEVDPRSFDSVLSAAAGGPVAATGIVGHRVRCGRCDDCRSAAALRLLSEERERRLEWRKALDACRDRQEALLPESVMRAYDRFVAAESRVATLLEEIEE